VLFVQPLHPVVHHCTINQSSYPVACILHDRRPLVTPLFHWHLTTTSNDQNVFTIKRAPAAVYVRTAVGRAQLAVASPRVRHPASASLNSSSSSSARRYSCIHHPQRRPLFATVTD